MNAEAKPLERSGQSTLIYNNQFLFVFGGMQEVTNELNDCHVFDLKLNKWHTLEEANKSTSAHGTPSHKP